MAADDAGGDFVRLSLFLKILRMTRTDGIICVQYCLRLLLAIRHHAFHRPLRQLRALLQHHPLQRLPSAGGPARGCHVGEEPRCHSIKCKNCYGMMMVTFYLYILSIYIHFIITSSEIFQCAFHHARRILGRRCFHAIVLG